jgi:hypothetical protein
MIITWGCWGESWGKLICLGLKYRANFYPEEFRFLRKSPRGRFRKHPCLNEDLALREKCSYLMKEKDSLVLDKGF